MSSMADKQSARYRQKLNEEHYRFINECMADEDELTAAKVLSLLKERFTTLNFGVSTVKRARMKLGWTAKRYSALISESNQEKQVEWCKERQATGDVDFDDVIFTDECTVQLESHRRITFYKKGQPIKYKMKAKHPPKVKIWAGISARGATKVVVFTGTLTATHYVDILESTFLPFLNEAFPDGHQF